MRVLLYFVAAACAASVVPPDAARAVLASAAGSFYEATPFLGAGLLLACGARRIAWTLPYLGCGCSLGASARSLPAMAAAWIAFGPFVACARMAAAIASARLFRAGTIDDRSDLAGALNALLSSAVLAGIAAQVLPALRFAHANPALQIAAGSLLGFGAAPCALGAIALGGALHARAPLAGVAFLCVAGIADARTLLRRIRPTDAKHVCAEGDSLAYALLALGCGIVAWRHGDGLVHPALALLLWPSALAAFALAVRGRTRTRSHARTVPAIMLLGALVSAPPPIFHASETTLSELFPGEHLTFTGELARDGGNVALVRYAITCCRADAVAVAVRIARPLPYPDGTWLRAGGTIDSDRDGGLVLAARSIERVAAPPDPFIYR